MSAFFMLFYYPMNLIDKIETFEFERFFYLNIYPPLVQYGRQRILIIVLLILLYILPIVSLILFIFLLLFSLYSHDFYFYDFYDIIALIGIAVFLDLVILGPLFLVICWNYKNRTINDALKKIFQFAGIACSSVPKYSDSVANLFLMKHFKDEYSAKYYLNNESGIYKLQLFHFDYNNAYFVPHLLPYHGSIGHADGFTLTNQLYKTEIYDLDIHYRGRYRHYFSDKHYYIFTAPYLQEYIDYTIVIRPRSIFNKKSIYSKNMTKRMHLKYYDIYSNIPVKSEFLIKKLNEIGNTDFGRNISISLEYGNIYILVDNGLTIFSTISFLFKRADKIQFYKKFILKIASILEIIEIINKCPQAEDSRF